MGGQDNAGDLPLLKVGMTAALSEFQMRNFLLCIAVITGALVFSGSRLRAQSAPDSAGARSVSSTIELKSGKTATILSVMWPGLGHLYAEDRRTGAVLMAWYAGAVALGIAGENSVTGPIPLLLGAGPWWYGVLDAHNAVTRYNHARTADAPNFQIQPAMMVGANAKFRFGIAMHLNY
jgi:hypothetical protein